MGPYERKQLVAWAVGNQKKSGILISEMVESFLQGYNRSQIRLGGAHVISFFATN